ncbi:S8 family serine peptidase [Flavobacteriaceae bacterium S356]|uniref:S8 family serine peptidase n=1 Tax=Asprobacillus argus TaxID=3076534 RepID=A0ABU3LEE8_9FLAO|nr:S8 family serine peptidase [Flavobacteriaceae bacterium S356]
MICLFYCTIAIGQEDAWVYFTDKPNASTYLNNPASILSQRAIDRRQKQNITLDTRDAPIEQAYYDAIKNTSGISVMAKSKWLNAIHVRGSEAAIGDLMNTFSFVTSIDFANKLLNNRASNQQQQANHLNKLAVQQDFNYGNATNQIEMLKGDYLHLQDFTGEGMIIAVLDAGFPNVNTLGAFQRLRDNNKILGGYNFVERSTNFYTRNSHGTHVLSDIGGYIEGQFVGTAPDASFYLFITEDHQRENPLEESLWVEAAERADSLGVDVMNTSLGYSTFDDSSYNYSYADMNGQTTFITRGAEAAASKGMLLVNSAGNSGNSAWFYITAPADAASILTVGAVNASRNLASFSSRGPTSDNRIKPDVMAQGSSSAIVNYISGVPVGASGTSFSSPIMAGAVACLWQAFPNKTASEIIEAVKMSGDRAETPDNNYGYGIPDLEVAFTRLTEENDIALSDVKIYPNPVGSQLTFTFTNSLAEYYIELYNVLGKKVRTYANLTTNTVDVSGFSKGIYILKMMYQDEYKTFKLIKR